MSFKIANVILLCSLNILLKGQAFDVLKYAKFSFNILFSLNILFDLIFFAVQISLYIVKKYIYLYIYKWSRYKTLEHRVSN